MQRLAAILLTILLPVSGISAQTILVHAHRGGRAARPENTLPAFQYGIAQGSDVLERDRRLGNRVVDATGDL